MLYDHKGQNNISESRCSPKKPQRVQKFAPSVPQPKLNQGFFTPAGLQSLQSTIGNRRVAQLLESSYGKDEGGRRESHVNAAVRLSASPARRGNPACGKDGSKPVQRLFAVQVGLNNKNVDDKDPVISGVHIAGRPKGLFKDAEKSHTTAWSVFTDIVRNGVMGLTVDKAMDQVTALFADIDILPGALRTKNLEGYAKDSFENAFKQYKAVQDKVDASKGKPPNERMLILQEYIAAYLSNRNVIPLTAVNQKRAVGHGEPEHLKIVRGADRGEAYDPKLVRERMWKLFDHKVVKAMAQMTDKADAPGTAPGESPYMRVADAVKQHCLTMQSAYPTAYKGCNFGGSKNIRSFLEDTDEEAGLNMGLNAQAVMSLIEGNKNENKAPENTARMSTGGPAGQGRFSVQIITDKGYKISEVQIAGRSNTLFGSSQGSHTTAWVGFCDSVLAAVLGKDIYTASEKLHTLFQSAMKLPGMSRIDRIPDVKFALKAQDQNVDTDEEEKGEDDDTGSMGMREIFKLSYDNAETAFKNFIAVKSNPALAISALQEIIKSYLSFRNVIPLSEFKLGPANGNGEGEKHKRVQANQGSEKALALDMWGMFDHNAVQGAMGLSPEDAYEAPGIHKNGTVITDGKKKRDEDILTYSDIIEQHILSMEAAYPGAVQRCHFKSSASVKYILNEMNCLPIITDHVTKWLLKKGVITSDLAAESIYPQHAEDEYVPYHVKRPPPDSSQEGYDKESFLRPKRKNLTYTE